MRDFHAGNKSQAGYGEMFRRNEEWNPYEGKEETVGGCCAGNCGADGMRNWNCDSMKIPELSEKERADMLRWSEKMPEEPGPAVKWPVPPMPVPERRNQPPRGPEPGRPMPKPEWGNQPPHGPEPGRPMPKPEWGNQPPREAKPGRPMPKPEWGNQPSREPRPGRPVPGPGLGNQPPREPRPGRSVPEPGWGSRADQSGQAAESRNGMSYIRYDYEDIIEEEKQTEKDLRMLQSMYPEAVREILPYVEEVCDRMEYEGSMMFDENPDKNTVRRLSDEIHEKSGDIWPHEPVSEPDGVMSMQYQGGGKGPLGELIQILLLQEMHHRRCRHRRCRPHMF